jgi:uncharacterized protein involved in exopolysaccharide biosynthesis
MNIVQFLRIIWARRFLIIVALVASVSGAYVFAVLVQPRYEAVSRVNIDILKKDPVSGLNEDIRSAGIYFDGQQQLIKDYSVTGPVVDRLGWLSDPGLIRQYQGRPVTDTRDFRLWLAQRVAEHTTTEITASTVMEITFNSPDPVEAKVGAEALREAYLNAALATKRENAEKLAAWYNQQSGIARQAADEAEAKKAAYEKETGIVLQANETDMDSGRLAALANQLSTPNLQAGAGAGLSSAHVQLAQLDGQIAQQSKNLGPNHPEMQALKAQRAALAQAVAQEDAQARKVASGESGAAALSRVMQEEKARVISERDKVEKLRQLQSEVDLRRDQYKTTAARAAELALQGSLTDPGLTPMGIVVAPTKPAFPNKPLIIGGAGVLGLGLGLGLALLLELLNRRVRGIEDLNLSSELKCIAVVRTPRPKISVIRRILGLGPPSRRPAVA